MLIGTLLPLTAARGTAAPPLQTGTPKPQLTILALHGPNLNLLGRREPQIYGTVTLDQINKDLDAVAKELNVNLIKIQSNHEGVLVDNIEQAPGSLPSDTGGRPGRLARG